MNHWAAISRDWHGKVMTDVQPMKMAAAEGLYEDVPEGVGAPFSKNSRFVLIEV